MTISELITQVTLAEFGLAVALLVALIVFFFSQKEKVMNFFNKWRKKENKKENFESIVYDSQRQIKELTQARIDDREKSREIREQMYKDLNVSVGNLDAKMDAVSKNLDAKMDAVSKSLESLSRQTTEISKREAKRERAKLKEKIESIYRECNKNKKITSTQLEALKDLIEEYEIHGGTNSFVHTLVLKDMYKWEVEEN